MGDYVHYQSTGWMN